MSTDTSNAAVERLADVFDRRGPSGGGSINGVVYGTVAATLRALLAEREALEKVNAECGKAYRRTLAERDAARAVAVRTAEALRVIAKQWPDSAAAKTARATLAGTEGARDG